MYEFALEREFPGVEYNPATSIKKIGQENEKERNLSPDEVIKFWRYFDSNPKINESTVRCLKFILVTMQRPSECLHIEKSEIDGDWWIIPKERMKTAKTRKDKVREQRVFFTETAKQLLGDTNPPFPVPSNHRGMSLAVARILGENRANRLDINQAFTPHDLRRTGATMLASLNISQESIDKVLGHVLPKVQRTYNRHEYDEAKKEALIVYEKRLLEYINFMEPHKPS